MNTKLLLVAISIFFMISCESKNDSPIENRINTPKSISIVNNELGDVTIFKTNEKEYRFEITPKSSDIDWEVYKDNLLLKTKSGKRNWQGTIALNDINKTEFKIIFIGKNNTNSKTYKTPYPYWVKIINGDLGNISVSKADKKDSYEFEIKPNNKDINWEFFYYKEDKLMPTPKSRENWSGILESLHPGYNNVKLIFVDGPIVSYLKDTNIPYRYDLSWEGTLTKEEVRRSYFTAIRNIENSNASELADILRNVKKELFANKDDFANGYAYGDSLLKMNIKQTLIENYYSTVWIHEIGHIYEALHPQITPRLKEIYKKAQGKFLYPKLYYNTNHKEMWACAIASYVLNDPKTGGAHDFIANEPYYHSDIVPYIKEVFKK